MKKVSRTVYYDHKSLYFDKISRKSSQDEKSYSCRESFAFDGNCASKIMKDFNFEELELHLISQPNANASNDYDMFSGGLIMSTGIY